MPQKTATPTSLETPLTPKIVCMMLLILSLLLESLVMTPCLMIWMPPWLTLLMLVLWLLLLMPPPGASTLVVSLMDATMAHLANVGPLAVAVDASSWSFYSGGVFDGCSFSDNIGLNHAVQMVGYGTDPTEGDYW